MASRTFTALAAACVAVVVTVTAMVTATGAAVVAADDTSAEATTHDRSLVRTDAGWVRGRTSPESVTYSGIPYAAPPVGERRWAPPQRPRPWSGVRDATVPASSCPQWGSGPDGSEVVVGEEDCLYLNVTVPRGVRRGARLPVMVWLHGGSFTSGAGSEYGADRLVSGGDVVVVTVNYRLGALGFLSSPALDAGDGSSGNYGLQDQAAALRWLQRNAARFGGDPGNVTLSGQSAGARSICAHLAAPGSEGLFHKAIMQSGPCANPLVAKPVADQRGARVAGELGCASSPDVAGCLRSRPVADVLGTLPDQGSPLIDEYSDEPWMPVVGTSVLPEQPLDALARGAAAGIPLLVGAMRDEMRSFVGFRYDARGNPLPEPQYRALVEEAFGPDAAAILDRYPAAGHPSPAVALATLLTDWGGGIGACPLLRTAQEAARHTRVFAYELAEDTGQVFLGFPMGAYHGWDLPFLWDLSLPQNPYPDLDDGQRALSEQMIASWTAFARTGDPGDLGDRDGGDSVPGPVPIPWAPFGAGGAEDGPVLSLAAGPGGIAPVPFAADHQCDFWLSR